MDMVLFNGQVLPHLYLAVTALQAHQAVGHNVLLHLTLKYVPRLKALIAKEQIAIVEIIFVLGQIKIHIKEIN